MYSVGRRSTVGDFKIHFYYLSTQELYPEELTFILLATCPGHSHKTYYLYLYMLCMNLPLFKTVHYFNAMVMDLKLIQEKIDNVSINQMF